MTKPSKQQIADVKSALREIRAELLGWDPHILVAFDGEAQKAQIIARMMQLGWHYVDDPSNETGDVSIAEFSLDKPSQTKKTTSARHSKAQRGKGRRVWFPAPFFASFAVLSALVGVIFAIATFYTDYRMGTLDKAGTRTTGRVANIYFRSSRGGRTDYVFYRFVDTHGITRENEDIYPFDDWNTLHHGDPIDVTFLANDPQQNKLTRRVRMITSRSLGDEIPLLSIPWAVAGSFFLGYLVRKRWR